MRSKHESFINLLNKFWEAFVKKKISSMFSNLKEKDSFIHSLPSEDSQNGVS